MLRYYEGQRTLVGRLFQPSALQAEKGSGTKRWS